MALPPVPPQRLADRLWFVACESCLAFVSFRTYLGSDFVAQLALLSFLKCLHCVAYHCIAFVDRNLFFPRYLQLCYVCFLLALAAANVHLIVFHCSAVDPAAFRLFFYFEHSILLVAVLSTVVTRVVRRLHLSFGVVRENDATSRLCSFIHGLVRALLYVGLMVSMIEVRVFPLFAAHPTYLAVTQLKRTAVDFFASYRADRNGNALVPGATTEEPPAEDNGCVICREEMGTEVTALPCGHVFHTSCLRSWFQHQWTCPMCRLPVRRSFYPELMPPQVPVQPPQVPVQPPQVPVQPPQAPVRPSTPPQTPPDPQPEDWYPSEEEEEEEEEPPSGRVLPQETIEDYQRRFRRLEGERVATWLLRCWDDGADDVHLEGGEVRRLGPLCGESAVDNAMCRREERAFTLWKRMLGAVRQRYRRREQVTPRIYPWFTLDEGIGFLRELAVVEMLYGDSFDPDDPNADDCPDGADCSPTMWWLLSTSAPPQLLPTVTAVRCVCNVPTSVQLLVFALRDYDKNVAAPQRHCFALVQELAQEVKRLSRELQQLKDARLCPSASPGAAAPAAEQRPPGSALALVEEGCVPRLVFWHYLRDHGENMRRWDGKPTSALQRRVEELLSRGGPSTRRRAAARRRDASGAP